MDSKPLPLISRTGLIVLVLAYAIALPWLIWSEAVKLVPLLCALVFGYCLIRPFGTAFGRASQAAKVLVVTLIGLTVAAIVMTVMSGYSKTLLLHLRDMPTWLANHLFFGFFALLPLAKGIAVGCIQLISNAVSNRPNKP